MFRLKGTTTSFPLSPPSPSSHADIPLIHLCHLIYYLFQVKNPEKYHFDPRSLLEKLVHIFINLGGRRAFATAVANDGRSYSHTMFMRALDIMRKQHGLRPPFPMVLLPLPITSYLSMPSRLVSFRHDSCRQLYTAYYSYYLYRISVLIISLLRLRSLLFATYN